MESDRKRVLFIVNPRAGITPKSKLFIRLLAGGLLDPSQFTPEVKFTEYAGHATELAREAVNRKVYIVVAAGGDGTINEVARALVHTGTAMGILPLGSGNGLAFHLKIPMALVRAVMIMGRNHTRMIDTVQLNDHLFISIAGIGFDAYVAEKFSRSEIRGLISYIYQVLRVLKKYTPRSYTLSFNGNTIQREAMMISFANSDQFGFRSRIAPQAKIDDGLLDICIVKKPAGIFRAIGVVPRLFNGSIGKSNLIEYFPASSITMPGSAGSLLNIDGEPVRVDKDIEIKILPKSLKVLVP